MFNVPVIKSQLGQNFIITPLSKANQLPSLKAQSFNGVIACKQFISQLNAPIGYWQQLAQQLHTLPYQSWKAQNPWGKIEDYIAQAISQGLIKIFKAPSLKDLVITSSSRTIKTAYGKRYQIRPASSVLLMPLSDQQKIQSVAEATQFIEQLALDEDTLLALNASTANAQTTTTTAQQQLAEAIADGKLVVDLEPEPTKPLTEGEFVEEVVQITEPEPSSPEAPQKEEAPIQDDKASSEVLEKAAEEGTPFCEECEKDKEENNSTNTANQTTPEPVPRDDEQSAATLMNAAEEGAPFCEECEKAKEANSNKAA